MHTLKQRFNKTINRLLIRFYAFKIELGAIRERDRIRTLKAAIKLEI